MMHSASRRDGPAVLCLGRTGDVTAALPIAHELFYQTGSPVAFITARQYTPILDGCSYVSPVPFDAPFHHLARAMRHFHNRYSKLHVAQMYATDEHMGDPGTDSFVTDAWRRAGMLDKFGLPLVIDKRDPAREAKLLSDVGLDHSRDYIAVHLGGVSSPYPYRLEMLKALRIGVRIIDITALMAEKPQDLLAVLERASCAILADSFPLHLSYALPNLPVIALQTDRPNNWFGSPKRQNWIANYRYEESKAKLTEIAAIAFKAQPTHKPATFSFPAGAYNASMLGKLHTWRFHPNGTWLTKLRGSDGSKEYPIVLHKEHKDSSHEDARLFMHDGKPHVSYTVSKLVGKEPRCIVEYGELTFGRKLWHVDNPHRVKFGRYDFSDMEKNHVFWSQDGKLYCMYGSRPEQLVLEVEGDKVVAEHRCPPPTWGFGTIRGDVILPYDGKLLRVFHSCVRYPSRKFRYHIGVALLEPILPFRTISLTKAPIFSGNELRARTLHNSKPNVVFCCGATIEGDELVLPLSRDDDSTTIERVNIKQLHL